METYRVEDTMNRIAHSYGLHDTYSFVTSTAIIFSLNDRTNTRLIRIRERTTDLEKSHSLIVYLEKFPEMN